MEIATTTTGVRRHQQPAPQHSRKACFVDEADGEPSMVLPLERVVECDPRELAVHVDRYGYYCEPERLKGRPRVHAVAIPIESRAWIYDPDLNLYYCGRRQG